MHNYVFDFLFVLLDFFPSVLLVFVCFGVFFGGGGVGWVFCLFGWGFFTLISPVSIWETGKTS